jgi:hypothetical protein
MRSGIAGPDHGLSHLWPSTNEEAVMNAGDFTESAAPDEVARATQDTVDVAGDAADQAERLSMVMEAEALHNALHPQSSGPAGASSGVDPEGSLDGLDYPLEDTEELLAVEDAEDASDDPMHAGGLQPGTWMPAEQAAMHVIDPDDPEDPLDGRYASDLADDDSDVDPFDRPGSELTAEDETLLGIDPYEAG